MVNLLDELVYVSLQDARDTSDVFTAIAPTDSELTTLLTEAQRIIDNYIRWYGTKFDPDQTFIFPINYCEDSCTCQATNSCTSLIPIDIQIATIQIAEYLYLQGPTTISQLTKKDVKSEKNISRSVIYTSGADGSYKQYIESIEIPKKTLNILNKYRSQFIGQIV